MSEQIDSQSVDRRPLKSRDSKFAARLAMFLARHQIAPNTISLSSIFFSCVGGSALIISMAHFPDVVRALLFLVCAVAVQLRLLCNLLDGMVAIEGGKSSRAGELFNDVPDRFADIILFVCAGAIAGFWLGFFAAILAVLTAYIRVLGKSIGARSYFTGPMAKQHRMFVLTLTCIASCAGAFWNLHRPIFQIALSIIIVGCLITIVRRLGRIGQDLESR